MKSRIFRGVLFLAVLACCASLGYHAYRWHAAREREKALARYFRQTSPVTRKMPADAILYLNLYNARRLLDEIQNTRLSRVYNRWLDTGMGDDTTAPNSMLGGVLEKTIMNVAGEELGLAIVPGASGGLDFVAVSRLVPGSDFLLKLALSQNRKYEHVSYGEETIYAIRTRNPEYPRIFLYLDSDFAYASSSMERIQASSGHPGNGPSFLSDLPDETLPENTLLYAKGNRPRFSVLGFLENKQIRLHTECEADFEGPLPSEAGASGTVLEFLTNIPEIVHQPAVWYSIHRTDAGDVSTALLAFADADRARDYGNRLLKIRSVDLARPEASPYEGLDCSQISYRKRTGILCTRGALLWMADGMMDPQQILNSSGVDAPQKRPLILRVKLNHSAVNEFGTLADREDWSRFAESKALFFLSSIRSLQGGVDDHENEIVAQFQ